MKSEKAEIRQMLDEMRGYININETYMFPSDTHVKEESNDVPIDIDLDPISSEEPTKENIPVDSVKEKLGSIRKIAIGLLGEVEPTEKPEDYKTIKSILDLCDKFSVNKPEVKNDIK
jgi:hypothetical protein